MSEHQGVAEAIKKPKSKQKRTLPSKNRWKTLRNGPLAVVAQKQQSWHRNSFARLRRGIGTNNAVVPIGARRPVIARRPSNARTDKHTRVSLARLTKRQMLQILHRVVTLGAALLYLVIALEGVIATLEALVGVPNPPLGSTSSYSTSTIGTLVGNTSIRDSALVQQLLGSQTVARSDTMFVDLDDYVSFSRCSQSSTSDAIYSNVFLRRVYAEVVRGAAYNVTFLSEASSELIVPIVDCTSEAIEYEDTSVAKIFYLVRNRSPKPELHGADEVALVVLTMSNQVYEVPNNDERGPFGAATIAVVFDVAPEGSEVQYYFLGSPGFPFKKLKFELYEYLATTEDWYWKLRMIPRDSDEAALVILTTCRTGFYWKTPSFQSNINHELWGLPTDPLLAITNMKWFGAAVTQNTWAWAHLIHLVFDLQTFTQIVILMVVIYRNWQAGKLWVGDAFSQIANTLMLRGGFVLITWSIDGFWTLTEYCMSVSNHISGVEEVFVHKSVMHADLMTVFLMIAGVAGRLLHERIDPPLTMVLFELGFHLTRSIIESVPSLTRALIQKSEDDYALGVVQTDVDTSSISPMGMWSAHALPRKDGTLIAIVLSPLLLMFVVLVCVVLSHKTWRILAPSKSRKRAKVRTSELSRHQSQHRSRQSSMEDEPEEQPHGHAAYTQFELATGVELARRYGVLCDYESARMVKGMTFASADGVYSCGFVVVYERVLVATTDLAPILLMKLLRLRFRNIYAYDVEGHDVQAMARLVYPDTLSFRDLTRLNINLLS
jgi:hypothetical protein